MRKMIWPFILIMVFLLINSYQRAISLDDVHTEFNDPCKKCWDMKCTNCTRKLVKGLKKTICKACPSGSISNNEEVEGASFEGAEEGDGQIMPNRNQATGQNKTTNLLDIFQQAITNQETNITVTAPSVELEQEGLPQDANQIYNLTTGDFPQEPPEIDSTQFCTEGWHYYPKDSIDSNCNEMFSPLYWEPLCIKDPPDWRCKLGEVHGGYICRLEDIPPDGSCPQGTHLIRYSEKLYSCGVDNWSYSEGDDFFGPGGIECSCAEGFSPCHNNSPSYYCNCCNGNLTYSDYRREKDNPMACKAPDVFMGTSVLDNNSNEKKVMCCFTGERSLRVDPIDQNEIYLDGVD